MIKNILVGTFLVLVMMASAGATEVKVDPASQTVAAGDAFHVNVTVENVANMRADQAVLNFNPDVMCVTNITEGDFLKTGGNTLDVSGWDNATGTATLGYSLTDAWTPVNGSGTLATIEFEIGPDAPPGTYDLNLTDVLLINGSNEEISTDTSNGTVTIPTEVKVDPASQTIAAGDAFHVNVTVENVVGMKANQAVLNFDPGVMQVTNITDGNFLKTGGGTIGASGWNNTTGIVWFGYSLTGDPGTWTPVNGSGTLATIQFSTNDTECTYNLNLTEVILINASNVEIPTDTVNGTVTKDGTPPTVEITSPPDGYWFDSENVVVTFHPWDNKADMLNYSIYVGGVEYVNGTAANCSDEIANLGILSECDHVIRVVVKDCAGKTGSDSITIHVDLTPPTVEIISPESRAYASTCVRLNFTAEDPSVCPGGIDWIGYSLDGGANVTIAGNITIGTLGAGSHTIVVYVNDTVGKEGSDAVSFTLHPGDINDDDIVDIWDLVLLADAYLSKPGDSNWDPDANLNCDGTVDIWDLVILADNYLNEY